MAHFHGSIAGVFLHGNGESQAGGIPAAPSDVEGTPTGGTTATLSLTENSGGTASHRWQVRLVAGTWADATGATNPSAPGVTTFAATGLTAATEYEVRARAESGGGDSAYAEGLATFTTDNTGTGGGEIPLIASVSGAGGIDSSEAFGVPTVVGEAPYSVSGAGGIASGEAFGTPSVSADGIYGVSDAGGIVSGEAFGVPTVTPAGLYSVSGAGGIASGEAFGLPTVSADGLYSITDAGGIASGEAFGLPTVAGTFPGGTGATAAEIAEAVWTRILEGGITAEQWVRIIAAPLSGTASGIGTSTERYKSRDGTKDRVVATFDDAGNRTTVTVDGS